MTTYRIETVPNCELEKDVSYPSIAVPRAVRDRVPRPPGTTYVLREEGETVSHVLAAAEREITNLQDELARYRASDERRRYALETSKSENDQLREDNEQLKVQLEKELGRADRYLKEIERLAIENVQTGAESSEKFLQGLLAARERELARQIANLVDQLAVDREEVAKLQLENEKLRGENYERDIAVSRLKNQRSEILEHLRVALATVDAS